MTHLISRRVGADDMMRLVIMERHPSDWRAFEHPYVLARFAGSESVRLLEPAERCLLRPDEWRSKQHELLHQTRDTWDPIGIRYGRYAERRTLDVALGGPLRDILAEPDKEDAFDFVRGAQDGDRGHWSEFANWWDARYGWLAGEIERRHGRRPLPLDASLGLPPAAGGSQPGLMRGGLMPQVRVTRLFMRPERGNGVVRRYLLETMPRRAQDGRYLVGTVSAWLRGVDSATLTMGGRRQSEFEDRSWPAERREMLDLAHGYSIDEETMVAHGREHLEAALGPRLLRALGGEASMRFLMPGRFVNELVPARSEPADLGADAERLAEDNPLFGAF